MKRFFIFILIFAGIFVFVFGSSFSRPSYAVSVKIAYVKKSAWIKNITAPGIVHSNGRMVFSAPFSGRIIESLPAPGYVTPGTVIARIVRPGLYAKIIAAKASVKYAETKLKRTKLLFHDGVAAKKDVERADLFLADAYSALHTLESYEREGIFVSHFKGAVHYLVPNGAIVTAGSPAAILNGKGIPWIRAYITPSASFKLKDNMRAGIKAGRFNGAGKIIAIGANASHNGLVPVYVSLPKNSSLLPGEWVRLGFAESKTVVFSLPEKAVTMINGATSVFVVKHGKALAVRVKVTGLKNGAAYVKGNIKAGEPVIVYPVTRLISGIPVEIRH
ncbi:MAG: efflux RND transporter periplasmic adaptor subunit [bacterium]